MMTSKERAGEMPAIRVFVGTSAAGEDAEACMVCEHSLRRRTSRPVEITWLRLSQRPGEPGHGWNIERWSSPWTGLRWIVPELCRWEGRAIYFDCPQIIRGDVGALIDADMPRGAMVLLRREGPAMRTGAMLWDCAAAARAVPGSGAMRADPGAHQAMGALLIDQPRLVADLPPGWGVRDAAYARAPAEATGSVHCANPYMQPHVRRAIPRLRRARRSHWFDAVRLRHFCAGLEALFEREYAAACEAGASVEQYVPKYPWIGGYGPRVGGGEEARRA